MLYSVNVIVNLRYSFLFYINLSVNSLDIFIEPEFKSKILWQSVRVALRGVYWLLGVLYHWLTPFFGKHLDFVPVVLVNTKSQKPVSKEKMFLRSSEDDYWDLELATFNMLILERTTKVYLLLFKYETCFYSCLKIFSVTQKILISNQF